MAAQQEVIVAIQPEGATRPVKLAKLLATKDGSFALMVPYHPIKRGVVSRLKLEWPPPGALFGVWEGRAQVLEQYVVDQPIKLSIHLSGFVQFSSAGR